MCKHSYTAILVYEVKQTARVTHWGASWGSAQSRAEEADSQPSPAKAKICEGVQYDHNIHPMSICC